MDSITISMNDILYNNIMLALIAGIVSIILLFIDRCVFIKKNNYITYIKLFVLVFVSTYLILLFKDTNVSKDTFNLEIDNSPFK